MCMFEDKQARWSHFVKSGWREAHEDLERHGCAYSNVPDWTESLNGMAATNDWLRGLAKATPGEIANPKLIPWWPNPGKMPRMMSDPTRQAFLQRLNDWFYKELSGKGHLSLIGFASGPAHLLLPEGTDMDLVHKYRSNSVFTTVTLLMVLMSEIEVEFKFGLADQLKYLWTIVSAYWGEAKELYDARYAAAL